MADFLEEVAYSTSPKAHAFYADQLRPFREYLLAHRLSELHAITREHCVSYLAEQRRATYHYRNQPNVIRTLSPTSLDSRHRALKRFFAWCAANGYIAASPMATVPRPRGEQRARHAFTPEEVGRMMKAAGAATGILAHRDRAMLLTLLGTGCRAGELVAMSTDCSLCPGGCLDMNRTQRFPHGSLMLHGKGAKDRRVPLGTQLRKALQEWLRHRPFVPGAFIWTTQRRTVFTVNSLNAWASKLEQYADVEDVHPHRFRHTFAVEFYKAHRDIEAVKNRLGHTDIAVTQRYLASLGCDYGMDASYATPDEWLAR